MFVKSFPMDPLISTSNSNEYFNAISHLVGTVLALIGSIVLISFAVLEADGLRIIAFSIYGLSLILSCLFSTLLHFFLLFGVYKRVLGILDHVAIYILIAGSYTPFSLLVVKGAASWILLALAWGLAILFICLKAIFFARIPAKLSLASYISLGWIVLPFLPYILGLGQLAGLLLLLSGLTYSIGGLIMLKEKPDPWPPYFGSHEIWHVCVLVGHALMYGVMLLI